MNDEIMVTVACAVYNHEKYLRRCLDGFVMQKTSFRYEVIVHDDASTDHSASIIREYELKYPDIIKPIYQKVNQYSQKKSIFANFIIPAARGKYLASCEGDDFWCDEYKLQLQFDAMERHPECHLGLHTVNGISEDEKEVLSKYPQFDIKTGVLSQEEYYSILGKGYPFQTSSYFRYTEDVRNYHAISPEFKLVADVGDEPWLLYAGTLGPVYYIGREMSCYRKFSVESWTLRQSKSKERQSAHYMAMIRMYDEFNKYSSGKYYGQLASLRRKLYLNYCVMNVKERENAKVLLKKENRDVLKMNGSKFSVMAFCYAYCPWIMTLYNRSRGEQ